MIQLYLLVGASLLVVFSSFGRLEAATLIVNLNGVTPPATHYLIDYSNPAEPSLRIRRPATGYVVTCIDGGGPGDINQITTQLDSGYYGNVQVRVINTQGGAGARNIRYISLVPPSGSYYTSIGNSQISGDLGSVYVYPSSSKAGGHIDFLGGIGGNITGIIQCYTMSQLTVGRHLASGAEIHVAAPYSSIITFVGDIAGAIDLQ